MLSVKNLHARIEGGSAAEILRGIDLEIGAGEVHAIMGANGSGKSTLANVLAGRDTYEITTGSVHLFGKELSEMDPEQRAQQGLFLAFQYPVELPGVLNSYFMRTALNSLRESRGEAPLGVREFSALAKEKAKLLDIDESFLHRCVNEGFSGGEKKKNEIFQMAMLEPKLAIMDETDSGLDIDALQIVAQGINKLREDNKSSSFLIITHYHRLLNYITPDFVHVMLEGRIVKSGGPELAQELEKKGYGWLKQEAQVGTGSGRA